MLLPRGPGETRLLTRPGFTYTGGAANGFFAGKSRIVFQAYEPSHGPRRYVMDAESGNVRPITPEGVPCPQGALSPDGRLLACNSPSGEKPGLYPVDGGEPRELAGVTPGDYPMAWSADARSLYLWRQEVPSRVFKLDLETGRKELWKELAPTDRAGVKTIYPVRFAPDGRSYAYSFIRTLCDLYLVGGLK